MSDQSKTELLSLVVRLSLFPTTPITSLFRETPVVADVLRVVPDSRILIETDRQVPVAAADELLRVCGAIAEAKGISVAEAAALANRNAALFLGELR